MRHALFMSLLAGLWLLSVCRGPMAFADSEDTTAPLVRITAPTPPVYVSGLCDIAVDASDRYGVSRVTVYSDGVLIGCITSPP